MAGDGRAKARLVMILPVQGYISITIPSPYINMYRFPNKVPYQNYITEPAGR